MRRKRRRQSNTSALRGSEAASSPQEQGHMRPSLAQGSSSFVGSGSGIYFVRTVQSAFSRKNSLGNENTIAGELIPGEDDQLQIGNSPASLWNPDEVVSVQEDASNTITFDDLVCWSNPYFNNWHPPFPFLHAPSILEILEKLSLSSIQRLSNVEIMIVRSILSISVADRRQTPPDGRQPVPSNLIFGNIDEAIASLTPILLQPSTLPGLQAVVAVQVFLVSMLRLNAASRIGGLVTRIAFHLGLHRCPSKYKQFSIAEADMRRRIFWAIYSLERFLSQSLGLPLDIKDDDIDVCYPDRELHLEGQRQVILNQNLRDPRLLLLPAFLARHGYIKGLILELRNKALEYRTADPIEVAHVDSEISKWWNEAQDLLDPHYMDSEPENDVNGQGRNILKESHKLLLIVQKHESTILLNRPVITSAEDSSLFAAAMQKCIGASKQIVSNVYRHLHAGMNEAGSHDGRIQNPLFWPGFTWCIWMSGLILIYAASEGHYPVAVSQKEAERCVRILESLSLRGNFWPGACAAALRDLQKALASKVDEGSQERINISHPFGMYQRPSTSTNANKNMLSTEQRHTTSQDYDIRAQVVTQADSASYASPATSDANLQPTNSRGTDSNNHVGMNNNSRPLTSNPQGSQSTFFPQQEATFWHDDWCNTNFGPVSGMVRPIDQFDGVGDIFQLMDASYQLSEQMF